MANSEDYLLLFVAAPGGQYPLDRIRVMKGMFLLTEAGTRTGYDFKAYNWGPFSQDVYRDLESLEDQSLIAIDGQRGRYESYRTTDLGEQRSSQLAREESATAQKIAELKELTTSLSFLDLLEYVYEEHPSYARRTKLRR